MTAIKGKYLNGERIAFCLSMRRIKELHGRLGRFIDEYGEVHSGSCSTEVHVTRAATSPGFWVEFWRPSVDYQDRDVHSFPWFEINYEEIDDNA